MLIVRFLLSLVGLTVTIRVDFYNYLQHGMDFLVDGTTHMLKKIVVHTNVVWVHLMSSDVRIFNNI